MTRISRGEAPAPSKRGRAIVFMAFGHSLARMKHIRPSAGLPLDPSVLHLALTCEGSTCLASGISSITLQSQLSPMRTTVANDVHVKQSKSIETQTIDVY